MTESQRPASSRHTGCKQLTAHLVMHEHPCLEDAAGKEPYSKEVVRRSEGLVSENSLRHQHRGVGLRVSTVGLDRLDLHLHADLLLKLHAHGTERSMRGGS